MSTAEAGATRGGNGQEAATALVESATRIVGAGRDGGPSASAVLPTVLAHVPAAILLIDLDERMVTYANRSALTLADQPLPVSIDRWGEAAGLTDLDDEPLAETTNPLSRLATGQPVAGQAVRLPGRGRMLWVSGFPLAHSPDVEQLALVVFLEITTDDTTTDGALDDLRGRAVVATDLAFTITDARQADNPLVWVNPAFTRATGYEAAEAEGRNCRFLQGPDTDPRTVEQIRRAVQEQVPLTTTLLNYRKDGTAFWNQLSISPVFDRRNRLVSFVGVQADVTERVQADSERDRAHAAERSARADSERARRRLALLAEAGRALSATLDEEEILASLATLVVPAVADWVILTLADEQGEIGRQLLRHRDGREELLERYSSLAARESTADSGIVRILRGSDPILLADTSSGAWRSHTTSDAMAEAIVELGLGSAMYVPLLSRKRRVLGTMTLINGPDSHRYDNEDLEAAADLGWRAGTTVDNARLYEHEHHTAVTLQHSLLPHIRDIDGLTVATTYLPGEAGADVGGDFYDLLTLPDGRIAFAVGDVVGHDLAAATAMGQLRGLLRSTAWTMAEEGGHEPGDVIGGVDRLVQGLGVTPLATLLFGLLERPSSPGGAWTLRYASAGHPAPLLRRPDGTVESLDAGSGLLIGVDATVSRATASAELPHGSVLVAYTDGLVERRGRHIDDGVRCVTSALSEVDTTNLKALAAALVTACGDGREDDTALIAVRFEA